MSEKLTLDYLNYIDNNSYTDNNNTNYVDNYNNITTNSINNNTPHNNTNNNPQTENIIIEETTFP